MRRHRRVSKENEFDYQKFAKAIEKARAEENEKYAVSREWMKFLLSLFLWSISAFSGIVAVLLIVQVLQSATTIMNDPFDFYNYMIWMLKFLGCLILVFLCLVSIFTTKEISKEKDKYYVATMFSNITAFLALVIALVALLKGVL